MVTFNPHNVTTKPMMRASLHEPKSFWSTFEKAQKLLETTKDSPTLRRAIEFVVAHYSKSKTSKGSPECEYGLIETFRFGTRRHKSLLRELANAKTVKLVGETFGWIADLPTVQAALRTRLETGKPTELYVPHPKLFPHSPATKTLPPVIRRVCKGYWNQILEDAHPKLQVLGVARPFPYVCMLTERTLTIKFNLATTYLHGFFWVYETSADPSFFSSWVSDDIKTISLECHKDRSADLIAKYSSSPPRKAAR